VVELELSGSGSMVEILPLVLLFALLVISLIVVIAAPTKFFAPLISNQSFKSGTRFVLVGILLVLIVAIAVAIGIKVS
jgi:hypothetical protein